MFYLILKFYIDLTGDNILMDENKNGTLQIKISDFGLSRKVNKNDKYVHSAESKFRINFSPPEGNF